MKIHLPAPSARARRTALGAVLGAALLITGCSASASDDNTLRIGASPTPHAEILAHAEEAGLLGDLELDVFTLSNGPEGNIAVSNGSADVNYLQHAPYFDDWVASNDVDNLVNAGDVHLEPMSVYSKSVTSLEELPDGAKITLPQSGSNYARALLLLQEAGLITLDADLEPANLSKITELDITENPKNLQLSGVEDEIVPHSLEDPGITAAIMSSNYAMQANLMEYAIHTESPKDNPYANILIASTESAQTPKVKKLVDALQSPEMAEWITSEYDGAVVPTHH